MDKLRLEQLAEKVVHALELLPYPEARKRAAKNQVDVSEVVRDGERLQVEVQYFFDSGRSGPVRIVVSVDDGRQLPSCP